MYRTEKNNSGVLVLVGRVLRQFTNDFMGSLIANIRDVSIFDLKSSILADFGTKLGECALKWAGPLLKVSDHCSFASLFFRKTGLKKY